MNEHQHEDLGPVPAGKPADDPLSALMMFRCTPKMKAQILERGGSSFLRAMVELWIGAGFDPGKLPIPKPD